MTIESFVTTFLNHMSIVSTITLLIVLLSIFLYFSIPSSDPSTDSFITLLNSLPPRLLRPRPKPILESSTTLFSPVKKQSISYPHISSNDAAITYPLGSTTKTPAITVTPSSSPESALPRLPAPCQLLRRILLVTSHPDDEVLFFAPLLLQIATWTNSAKLDEPHLDFIYSISESSLDLHKSTSASSLLLTKRNLPLLEVQVLCLSTGSAGGHPQVRQRELVASCEALGVAAHNIFCLNDPSLKDGLDIIWKPEIIAEKLNAHYELHPFDVLFTFDEKGISRHPNHTALYYGAKHFLSQFPKVPSIKIFCLQTPSFLLKYASWLAVIVFPFLSLISDLSFINSAYQVYAMVIPTMVNQHASQMKWFRYLFLLFSCTIIYNNFKEVESCR